MTDGETLTPAEAFAAVSNETRLAILGALAEGHWDMSFSELRAAVGMADSAQFNYHLKRLQPQFVLKTETGYRLRYAGKQVVRAIVVGTFTTDLTRGPFEVPGECVSCGAGLQATYEDEMLTVECGSCGRFHSKMEFPSSGLRNRSDEELPPPTIDGFVRSTASSATASVRSAAARWRARSSRPRPSTATPAATRRPRDSRWA